MRKSRFFQRVLSVSLTASVVLQPMTASALSPLVALKEFFITDRILETESFEGALNKMNDLKKSTNFGAAELEKFSPEAGGISFAVREGGKLTRLIHVPDPTAEALAEEKMENIIKQLNEKRSKKEPRLPVKQLSYQIFRNFLPDTAAFFYALGAIALHNVYKKADSNPMAVAQFWSQQKSPLSMMSFGAFSATQTFAGAWMNTSDSKIFRKISGPASMMAGMAASKFVSGLVSYSPLLYEHFVQCEFNVSVMGEKMDKIQMENCDVVKTEFSRMLRTTHLSDVVPSVAGMMSGFFVQLAMGTAMDKALYDGIAYGIETTRRAANTRVIVEMLTGEEATLIFDNVIARKLFLKSAQVVLSFAAETVILPSGKFRALKYVAECIDINKAINMGIFFTVQDAVENYATGVWQRHVTTRPDLLESEKNLAYYNHNQRWEDLGNEIVAYDDFVKDWREMSAKEAYDGYKNWALYMNNVTETYMYSSALYSKLMSKFFDYRTNPNALINGTYPLFGVVIESQPGKFTSPTSDNYLNFPEDTEKAQLDALKKLAVEIRQKMNDPKNDVTSKLTAQEKASIYPLVDQLASGDRAKVSAAIQSLEMLSAGMAIKLLGNGAASPLELTYGAIYKRIGSPEPQLLPGMAFLALMSSAMDEEGLKNPYSGGYADEHHNPVEYMLQLMIQGPDVERGQSLIRSTLLHGVEFAPPQVRNPGLVYFRKIHEYSRDPSQKDNPLNGDLYNSIFNVGIIAQQTPENVALEQIPGLKYANPLAYLAGGGIRPSALKMMKPNYKGVMTEANGFDAWWNTYVEPEFVKATEEFENKYADVSMNLLYALYTDDSAVDFLARSALANREDSRLSMNLLTISNRQFNVYLELVRQQLQLPANDPLIVQAKSEMHALGLEFGKLSMGTVTNDKGHDVKRLVSNVSVEALENHMLNMDKISNKLNERYKAQTTPRADYSKQSKILMTKLLDSFRTVKDYAIMINFTNYSWRMEDIQLTGAQKDKDYDEDAHAEVFH